MDEGKLKIQLLKELLKLGGSENKGVVVTGKIGSDAAVIDVNLAKKRANQFYGENSEVYLVEKSDPITFPTTEPGKHAVIVNANDITCVGALPYGFLATIIAPNTINFEEILQIQKQIHEQCKKKGITVLGGHTEISPSVNSIIISGHMFGFVPKEFLVPNELIIDEKVIVLGYMGAEGTGIIIQEAGKKISRILDPEEVEEGKKIGANIDVSELALEINRKFKPSFMHDATEGGLLGALTEIIALSEVGIQMQNEPAISKVTTKLANKLGFDAQKLISSGVLILLTKPKIANEIVKYCDENNIPCRIIGSVTSNKGAVTSDNKSLEVPEGDEIITALKALERI